MRTSLRSGIAVFGLLFATLATGTALAQDEGNDKIRKRDKSSLEGKIIREEMKGSTIMVGKAEVTVLWGQVQTIDYAGPPDFKKAKASVEAGNFADAIPTLEGLRKSEGLRPILKDHVLSWLAASQFRAGNVDGAIATYKELFSAFPKTQYLLSGGENLVHCFLQKNDAAGAGQALDQLLDTAKKAGADLTPFGLLRGRVKEALKEYSEALALYKQVEDSSSDEFTKSAAQLGRARCLTAQNKAAEAEAIYRQITASTKDLPANVMAGAWNGVGDILLASGRQKKDGDTIVNALFAYLRGCVQYVPELGQPTLEYERAIRGAAESFRSAGELEKDDKRKRHYLIKGEERMDYLRNKFPNSPYLQAQ